MWSMIPDSGFEVIDALDGKASLERFEKSGPLELALVDWNIPSMNGDELVLAMALMMATTDADETRMQSALDAGANEYPIKPVTERKWREKLPRRGPTAG